MALSNSTVSGKTNLERSLNRAMAANLKAERVSAVEFTVQSESHPDLFYSVALVGHNEFHCSCPARTPHCKHTAAVAMLCAEEFNARQRRETAQFPQREALTSLWA